MYLHVRYSINIIRYIGQHPLVHLGEPGTWNVHPHIEMASVKHSEFRSGATWVPGDYGEQSIRIEENISSVNTFSKSVRLFQGLGYHDIPNKETVYPESFLIRSFPLNKPKKSAHCGHSKSSDSSSTTQPALRTKRSEPDSRVCSPMFVAVDWI